MTNQAGPFCGEDKVKSAVYCNVPEARRDQRDGSSSVRCRDIATCSSHSSRLDPPFPSPLPRRVKPSGPFPERSLGASHGRYVVDQSAAANFNAATETPWRWIHRYRNSSAGAQLLALAIAIAGVCQGPEAFLQLAPAVGLCSWQLGLPQEWRSGEEASRLFPRLASSSKLTPSTSLQLVHLTSRYHPVPPIKMASATRQFARVATRASTRGALSVAPRQAFRQQGHRFYSSESAQKSSSAWYWIGGLTLAGGAGGYYYFSNAGAAEALKAKVFTPTQEDYQKVYNEIAARLDEKDDYDDGSFGPVLLRLAWHASGTYDKETGTGGSNGATMRFAPESAHGANAGLIAARDFLDPVKAKFPWISYSDLWILGGVTAIQEMQGPIVPYRPGRADRDLAACTPDGRLPDATKKADHLRDIFYRMGFNDQEIVALSGAHALGRCHADRSGFDGPWTFSPTVLTNDYFRLLIEEKWQWKKWSGPAQYEDKTTKSLMMLPSDLALIQDKKMKPWVEKYAKDNEVFFKDFSAVVLRLFELGVPFPEQSESARWSFKPTWAE
ncbi:hypothetical protein G7046_g8739 [Stylonectria norvegica]|nr:hypothetical protein G7046_g8739 [Stylonectria norvegica]